MFRSIITLVSVATLAAFVPAAHAQAVDTDSDNDTVRVHVAINPDDLATPTHVRGLYARIQKAASQACDAGFGEDLFTARKAERECRNEAVSDAVRTINAPELSALDRSPRTERARADSNADRLASR